MLPIVLLVLLQAFTERLFEANATDLSMALWASTKLQLGSMRFHVAVEEHLPSILPHMTPG